MPSSERLPDPPPRYDTIRHMLLGSPAAVQTTIKLLYKLNYAEPNDWSKLMPTGQPNEVALLVDIQSPSKIIYAITRRTMKKKVQSS